MPSVLRAAHRLHGHPGSSVHRGMAGDLQAATNENKSFAQQNDSITKSVQPPHLHNQAMVHARNELNGTGDGLIP